MSEPITIYCTEAHEWAARNFQPGDAMTIVAPSLVRELLASERWSFEAPEPAKRKPNVSSAAFDSFDVPPDFPVTPKPTPKRRGRGKGK